MADMDEKMMNPIYGPFFGVMGAAAAMIFSGNCRLVKSSIFLVRGPPPQTSSATMFLHHCFIDFFKKNSSLYSWSFSLKCAGNRVLETVEFFFYPAQAVPYLGSCDVSIT